MRRIRAALPLLLLCGAVSMAEAQTHAVDRGSLLIAGSAGFSSSGSDGSDERTTQILLQPRLQYFIVPGLALGGQFLIRRISDDDDSSTTVGVGPEMSYYFGAATTKLAYPFLSAGLQIYEGDTDAFGFGGSAGLLIMLAEAVGLETALYYREMDYDDFGTDVFGLSVGISAFIF